MEINAKEHRVHLGISPTMISESTGDIAMMSSPDRKVDTAIVSLLGLLPPEITELWWNTGDLSGFLRCGGVTGITVERLRKALFASQRLVLEMRQLIKDSFVCHKNLATCTQHYQTPACVLDWNEFVSLWSYESANVGMHNT